jgi:hypothetical protein
MPRVPRSFVARCFVFVSALACLAPACRQDDSALIAAQGSARVDAYRGLGTWVDVYDYVPEFQKSGEVPAVTPDSFADMARLGVRTVYLQAAQDDERSPGVTIDPTRLGAMLRAAHAARLRVVAWYLPRFASVDSDLQHVRALLDFKSHGERFDGLALDIEWTKGVPDPVMRNTELVDFSKRARSMAGSRAIGAIVLEPVLLEVVNPAFWPDFPWQKIRADYDVWLPMSYWTNRRSDSGYRDGNRYTDENVRRLRKNLDDANARVHVIGGIGDAATTKDYEGFVAAARNDDAIGWSVYDFTTTSSAAWPKLRKG